MNGAAGLVRRALPPGAGSSGFNPPEFALFPRCLAIGHQATSPRVIPSVPGKFPNLRRSASLASRYGTSTGRRKSEGRSLTHTVIDFPRRVSGIAVTTPKIR